MRRRFAACAQLAGVLAVASLLSVMLPRAAAGQPGEDSAAVPRTPWGTPDFSGYWMYGTTTPLQRPAELAGKTVLTPEEAQAYLVDRYAGIGAERDLQLNADWWVPGELTSRRTALIVDPPDGRIPRRTAAGEARLETLAPPLRRRAADGPEDRERYERCIMGRSIPMEARPAPRLAQVFHSPDHVIFLNEQNFELRVIPLTGRPRLADSIRQWRGDARGRWEGETLVVETTNFNGKWTLHGAGPELRLVERLSFSDPDTLQYEFTVHDASSFDSPWTVRFPTHARDRAAVRVRLPRGESQHAADPAGCPRGRGCSGQGRAMTEPPPRNRVSRRSR